jgi:hypothetical protein
VGEGKTEGKGALGGEDYGRNVMYSCMKMKKWDLLKLFQEWGGIKENDGGDEFTMICYKNFGKCHNVPPVQQLCDNKKILFLYIPFNGILINLYFLLPSW